MHLLTLERSLEGASPQGFHRLVSSIQTNSSLLAAVHSQKPASHRANRFASLLLAAHYQSNGIHICYGEAGVIYPGWSISTGKPAKRQSGRPSFNRRA